MHVKHLDLSRLQHVGCVKLFDTSKDFGFIEDFDGQCEIYVHASNVVSGGLNDGDFVRFTVVPSKHKKGSTEAHGVNVLTVEEVSALQEAYPQVAGALAPRVGRVKFFDSRKGFGFISEFDGDDIYVGSSGLKRSIRERDLVAFERRPSPRKRGTDEAFEVRPLRDYEGDKSFLLHYVRFDGDRWAGPLSLTDLEAPQLERLVDRIQAEWTPLNSEAGYNAVLSFCDWIKQFGYGWQRETADSLKKTVVTEATPAYRVRLWQKGWDEAFTIEAVAAAIVEADQSRREELLRRLSTSQLEPVIEQVVAALRSDPASLHALLDAAMQASLPHRSSGADSATPLERRRTRARLDGYGTMRGRYDAAFRAVETVTHGEAHFRLFVEGFTENVDAEYAKEYALQHGPSMDRGSLGALLEIKNVGAAFASALLAGRLSHAQETGPECLEEIRWLVALAKRHLPPEAAFTFGAQAAATLPVEEQLVLWKDRTVEAYPAAYLMHKQRSEGEVLGRSDIERILRYTGTAPAFAVEALEEYVNRAVLDHNGSGTPELIEAVRWTLTQAERHLGPAASTAIKRRALDQLPEATILTLWSNGVIEEPPIEHIRGRLHEAPAETLSAVEQWVQEGRMPHLTAASLAQDSIVGLPPVATRQEADLLRAHLRILFPPSAEDASLARFEQVAASLDPVNAALAWLHLWLEGAGAFDFDLFKSLVVFFPPSDQIRFIRKLFLLHESGGFPLTANRLEEISRIDADVHALAEHYHGVHLDLSAEVLIQAVVRLQQKGRFLLEGDLLRLVYAGLAGDPSRPLALVDHGLFDRCDGRMEADFDADSTRGTITQRQNGNGAYYRFHFEYDPDLVAAVKRLPGRRYDAESKTWAVPAEQENAVRAFAAEHRFQFELDGVGYKTANKHLFRFKRADRPNGILYCEGRKANIAHRFHGTEFWWCANRECFQNCASAHGVEEWERYTLFDFVGILGLDCDEYRQSGEVIIHGEYYKFVGTVNRFRRLLAHLQCRSCGGVLFPVESANFAYYRVTRFWCENEQCDAHRVQIYLHHCLSGRCNELIDSRDSRQCPNGWWICTNDECGSCCSHATNVRRLDNLRQIGGAVPSMLAEQVATEAGHLERGQAFCHQCGSEMNTGDGETFRCGQCGTRYGRSRRPSRRPPYGD